MKISCELSPCDVRINPEYSKFEIVERKFRGHPDTMADLVAQEFILKYIRYTWAQFPELKNRFFPNLSADKITLIGATSKKIYDTPEIITPIRALLMGKITERVGGHTIPVMDIFRSAVEDILRRTLRDADCVNHIDYESYSITQAGVDHHTDFYNPESFSDLVGILENETLANDTSYVVAYAPYSLVERLVVYIESITLSNEFLTAFPDVGTDIKCMAAREGNALDITLCIPVMPAEQSRETYDETICDVKKYLLDKIVAYVHENGKFIDSVKLSVNTKDTETSKYFALWGSAISKGDIGCVGRGNRAQGFISAMRPSTVEAFSGKNPNHFSGVIYQLVADAISNQIYQEKHIRNAIIIKANNGDVLTRPSNVHIMCDQHVELDYLEMLVNDNLGKIDELRRSYISTDPLQNFTKV